MIVHFKVICYTIPIHHSTESKEVVLMRFQATILIDNQTQSDALIAEHGLSILVTAQDGYRFLLDVGDSGAFLKNADTLGLDLNGLDAVVLSHGHYDHTGGLMDLVEQRVPPKEIYFGSFFFAPRYRRELGRMRGISARIQEIDLMKKRLNYYMLNPSTCYPLHEGIWLMTGFSQTNRFETPVKAMVRRIGDELIPDDFCDEIAVILDGEKSLTILSGCSHNGVINICQRASSYFQRPVSAFLGGTHLTDAEPARIRATVRALDALGLRKVCACHCNGEEASAIFARELHSYQPVCAGSTVEF